MEPVGGGFRLVTTPVDRADGNDEPRGPRLLCDRLHGLLNGKVQPLCSHCVEIFRCRPGQLHVDGFATAVRRPSAWTAGSLALLQATREVPSALLLAHKHWRIGRLPPDARLEWGQRAMIGTLDGWLSRFPSDLLDQRDFSHYVLGADRMSDTPTTRDMARHRLLALRKALAAVPPARFRELVETVRM
jgi:hypothetical protein